MRYELVRRRTGPWLALALFVGAVAGCDTRKNVKPNTAGKDDKGGEVTTPASNSAKQAANDIFKQLADGQVKSNRLTATFKKHLTKAFTDDDKKAGFSESDVQNFLQQFAKSSFEDVTEHKLDNATSFHGRVKGTNSIKSFSLRLVKTGNEFLVDWLHASERQCAVPETPTDPELASVYDTTRNFLDTLLGGDHTQTHSLMNPTWRKALAPPHQPDLNKGLDFDRGYLLTQTRSWRGDFVGYGLAKPEMAKKDEATIIAHMDSGNKKTPYLVKLSKNQTGDWVVDSFKAQ